MKINQLLGASYGDMRITKAMDNVEASGVTAGIYPIIKNTLKQGNSCLGRKTSLNGYEHLKIMSGLLTSRN